MMEWTNVEFLEKYRDGLKAIVLENDTENYKKCLSKVLTYLKKDFNNNEYHSSWKELYDSLKKLDFHKWKKTIDELENLDKIGKRYQHLLTLYNQLSSVAPLWAEQIINMGGNGTPLEVPYSWEKAWEWSKLNNWYNHHIAFSDIESIYKKLSDLRLRKSKLIEKLISKKAWKHLLTTINVEQKGALYPFQKTIEKITKSGRGIYDDKRRNEARNTMLKCAPAVPVWIMPIRKVLETLPPSISNFDVVIVDESSQCDLFTISILFRGKRILVVGDDKQVSPQAVGTDIAKSYYNLRDKFLSNIPNVTEATWGPSTSLFDKAQEIFSKVGSNIMLREHFRCVPEIIQWSNDHFYNGEIEPLRYPSFSERYDNPLENIFIPEGKWKEDAKLIINQPEANKLVEKIKTLCKNPKYKNKTMGVICLQGGMDQAFLIENKLRESIGEVEMQKRKLICGDSKHFQGDERDIIFLSMVVAPSPKPQALTKKDAQQRFNVAMTRAKDQVWLFHSVCIDDLNARDLRYSILEYFNNPKRVQIEMESAEEIFQFYNSSKFHQDVYKDIVVRGYRAIPEYKVGNHPYRIDIVIEGLNNRLAVECDGDIFHGIDQWEYDYNRQVELERARFTFWRIRLSEYYRDPQTSLQPLWSKLDKMGIYPFENKESESHEKETEKDFMIDIQKETVIEPSKSTVDLSKKVIVTKSYSRKINTLSYNDDLFPNNKIIPKDKNNPTNNELQSIINEILKNRPNNSCQKKHLTKEVLAYLGIIKRSKNRENFTKKINRALGQLKKKNIIQEYSTQKNIRVRLKINLILCLIIIAI